MDVQQILGDNTCWLCTRQISALWASVAHKQVSEAYFHFPSGSGVEGVPISGGEGQHASLCSAVVGLGDGVKLLLAGRVPQHQADIFSFTSATPKETRDKHLLLAKTY